MRVSKALVIETASQIADEQGLNSLSLKEVEEKYAGAISVEILIEKEDVYRVIFDLELCMAQLLIDTPFFALIKMFRLRWLRLKIKK